MDKTLLGSWWQPQQGCILSFSRFFEEKVYRVVYSAPGKHLGEGCLIDNGRSAAFEGRLVKINGSQFLDLFPADRQSHDHELLLHSVYKLKLLGDTLSLVPLDEDWIRRQSQLDQVEVSASSGDKSVALTADTGSLQRLVSDNADNSDAFNPANQITFHKRED